MPSAFDPVSGLRFDGDFRQVLQLGQPVRSFFVPGDSSAEEIRIPCGVLASAYQPRQVGDSLSLAGGTKTYFYVGDENHRDVGGGVCEFERVWVSCPNARNEFESWNWTLPGLQNDSTSWLVGGGFAQPSYSQNILRPQITVSVMTRLAHSYFVLDPRGAILASSPESRPSAAGGNYGEPVGVSGGTVPFADRIIRAMIIGKTTADGVVVSPIIGNDTVPSFSTWTSWAQGGTEVCVEGTQARRLRGPVFELITRWARAT